MLRGLDLFSGIGGISYALKEWVHPVAYCERDRYAQGVLLSRMAAGDLDSAPIWDDVTTLDGKQFKEKVDIIYAGFPCQDISYAGLGKGLAGERSGLFFEIVRLSKEIKPTFLFLENVPAIRTRGLDTVIEQFTQMGYDCRWCMLSAKEVGASHKRERWFLLAYAKSLRCEKGRQPMRTQETLSQLVNSSEYLSWNKGPENKFEVAGMANGLSRRLDRVKALGNAVVPLQAKIAFMYLFGLR